MTRRVSWRTPVRQPSWQIAEQIAARLARTAQPAQPNGAAGPLTDYRRPAILITPYGTGAAAVELATHVTDGRSQLHLTVADDDLTVGVTLTGTQALHLAAALRQAVGDSTAAAAGTG